MNSNDRSEMEYLMNEVIQLKKKVSLLEDSLTKQGNYLNKVASDVDNSD